MESWLVSNNIAFRYQPTFQERQKMWINISIRNGEGFARKHNLVEVHDFGKCDCETESFFTLKSYPSRWCDKCHGSGQFREEKYPFEVKRSVDFVNDIWDAVGLNPCMDSSKKVSGQISGRDLLDALTNNKDVIVNLILKKGGGQSIMSTCLVAIERLEEMAKEAIKRNEDVVWS